MDRATQIAISMVGVLLVAVVVQSTYTSDIIKAVFDGFTTSARAVAGTGATTTPIKAGSKY